MNEHRCPVCQVDPDSRVSSCTAPGCPIWIQRGCSEGAQPISFDVDALTKKSFEDAGFANVRKLDDGTWAGTVELLFTRAICTGLGPAGYAYRWCFEDRERALLELAKLKEMDEAPSGWVARRS